MSVRPSQSDLIEFFSHHARVRIFDEYSEADRARIHSMLDEIGFPRGEALAVLDCGCGTGRASALLAERVGEGGRVVGLDLTPEMIERAREIRPESSGVTLEFVAGDCHDLPFADGTIDWVVVLESFPHFGDKSRAIGEFSRILKAGGCVSILDRRPSVETNLFHKGIGGVVTNDRMPDISTLRDLAQQAGLDVLVQRDDSAGYRFLARKQ